MSDQSIALGPSITEAVRFMREVHKDIEMLIRELDTQLEESGWLPIDKGRVAYGVGYSLNFSYWLAECLYRFYKPIESSNQFNKVIAFVIRCDPPSICDEPVLLGTAVNFEQPIEWVPVYNGWKSVVPTIEGLVNSPGPRLLNKKETIEFLPLSQSAYGLVVPLCKLCNSQVLTTEVVKPLVDHMKS